MLRGAHLAVGLGVASFFTLDPIVLALAGFLSIVSDLDRPFHHRAWFSHSFYAAAIFAVVGLIASQFNLLYAFIVFLMVSVHVLLDFLTKSGVPLLHPWKKNHYGARLFTAKNKMANKAFITLGLLILLFNFWRSFP